MAAARDWAPRWDPVGGGARSVEEKKRQHLPTAPPHGGGWWAHRAFVWGAVEPRRRVPAGRWPHRAAAWGETEQGSYAAACRPAGTPSLLWFMLHSGMRPLLAVHPRAGPRACLDWG